MRVPLTQVTKIIALLSRVRIANVKLMEDKIIVGLVVDNKPVVCLLTGRGIDSLKQILRELGVKE